MAYISLYRKFRPQTFDSMIGQEHIVKTLRNQIKNDMVGHAYLFTGTRGTGKTSCAKIFAKAVNCVNNFNGSPCGQCDVCKSLATASNMDILEIDAASNNGVDEIRDIRDKVKYPPVNGRFKVYIIDEVHMLSANAFNALLKTLEEPPAHAIFILATTEVHKLPQTVLSRCLRFDFRLVSVDLIENHIAKIFDEIGKEYEREAIRAIAVAGQGSVRDALSIADMCLSYDEGKLTYLAVQDIIGASSPELLIGFIDSMLSGNLDSTLAEVDKFAKLGKNYSILSKDINETLRSMIYIKNCRDANQFLNLPASIYGMYKAVADKYNTSALLKAIESLYKLEGELKYSNQPRIVFESAIVRVSLTDPTLDNALKVKVKNLEEEIARLKTTGVTCNNLSINKNVSNSNASNNASAVNANYVNVNKVEVNKSNTVPINNTAKVKVDVQEKPTFNNEVEINRPTIESSEEFIPPLREVKTSVPIFDVSENGEDLDAETILAKVVTVLKEKELFMLQNMFHFNDVSVHIADNKFFITTYDEMTFGTLTNKENEKILITELLNASEGKFRQLVIVPPKTKLDMNKAVQNIKDLFDKDILTIKK